MTSGEDNAAKVAGGQQAAAPQSNFVRLISHLAKDSLAAKLVSAYAEPGDATPVEAISKVVTGHLDELKHSYDKPEDQPH